MASELTWIAVSGPEPEWVRSAVVDGAGVVYASGALIGERRAFYCAGFDGVAAILDGPHGYYPVEWLMREFPGVAEICRKIERRVREHLAGVELK